MLSSQAVKISCRALRKSWIWRNCRQFFGRHLLLVNTGTCTSLYMAGDIIQQHIEGCEEIDWKRTLRMAVLGVVMGPLNHGWYKVLDMAVKGAPSGAVVFKKVLADQFVMAPMSICVFYAGKFIPKHIYVLALFVVVVFFVDSSKLFLGGTSVVLLVYVQFI